MAIKTVAVQKLVYLQMMGYDISWAAFRVVEVMSQSKFGPKRAGYLAASQSFHEGTEVTMLVTNLLRKDFHSGNQYEAGVALATLSIIATPDLARDLAPDLLMLLTSSRPYVKKRATLCLYRVFLRYPEALRPSFPKLREKLVDDDPGVVSAACNVVCELARTAPANYLPLAPVFFRILTESSNNWLLIRIVKLLAQLAPVEKRLAKKLIDPLTTLINSTPAMSLMYECIQTSIAGCSHNVPLMKLCISKLRLFIEDSDQNLKYLGLVALGGILKVHPKAVAEHRDVILACLDDDDATIRLRALSLLPGLVTAKNLHSLVQRLMQHALRAEGGDFLDELVRTIIRLCSANGYELVPDFEWYFSVLVELTRLDATTAGDLIAGQMYDVACRVVDVRAVAANKAATLLRLRRHSLSLSPAAGGVCEALGAAAFIVGEYGTSAGSLISSPREVLAALLDSANVSLPPHVSSLLLAAGLKVALAIAEEELREGEREREGEGEGEREREGERGGVEGAREVFATAGAACAVFATSVHAEVQERATGFAALAAVIGGEREREREGEGEGEEGEERERERERR
jgi:AP-3 complex subunit delta-1